MTGYKSVQFAPDGDWITDYHCDSVDEAWNVVADQGSRWFFYPIPAVIRDNGSVTRDTQRIVDAPPEFSHLIGRTIKTFSETLAATPVEEIAALLS
jgi:hypothetical protein